MLRQHVRYTGVVRVEWLLTMAVLFIASDIRASDVEPMPLARRKSVVNLPGMCSTTPAARWEDGLLTGNGKMGAIVFGRPYEEQVIFNQEKLFRPFLNKRPLPPDISQALPEIRRLIKQGEYAQALLYSREAAAAKGHPKIVNTPPFHPAYALLIQQTRSGVPADYLRTTDFMTGEVVVRWNDDAGRWIRKTFVSRADNVIVQSIESRNDAAFDVTLSLKTEEEAVPDISVDWLTVRGKYQFTKRGYEGTTRVVCDDGTAERTADAVTCRNAKRVLLLTRITLVEDFDHSEIKTMQADLTRLPSDYQTLLARHTALHRTAMERTTFDLCDSDDRYLSSEELIQKQATSDTIIPVFLQKMFQMGRYALLSSSGDYPPNLSGIWNGSHKPAWSGDFTLDTNLNQQMTAANTCALPEALMSYLNLIEEIAPTWAVNARNLYGCRGYLSGIRTAGRENYQTHFGKFPGHFWTAGAAWLIDPLYEYYLVTGDRKFLTTRLLPLLENVVLFYEDFLAERDANGKFLFIPSYSPENVSGHCINAVMDIAAAKNVIRHLKNAYHDLGIKPDRVAELEAMLKQFPPYLINSEGVFQEWAFPGFAEHYDHRHMSQSYPVWPAHELSMEETPDFVMAMRAALERRGAQNCSAHAFVVRAFCAARTKYPQLFARYLYVLMRYNYIRANLITQHNPGWCPNTDSLCAFPAMVTEALVDSKPGTIDLLPAWSPRLPSGTVQGIRCRTQTTIESLHWDLSKKELSATVRSLKDQWVTLHVRQGIQTIQTTAATELSEYGNIARRVHLPKDKPVQLRITLRNVQNDYNVNPVSQPPESYAGDYVKRMLEKKQAGKK